MKPAPMTPMRTDEASDAVTEPPCIVAVAVVRTERMAR